MFVTKLILCGLCYFAVLLWIQLALSLMSATVAIISRIRPFWCVWRTNDRKDMGTAKI